MPKTNYQTKMHQTIDFYINELFKFLKLRNILKTIDNKLTFSLNSPLPIYINKKISQKI
jgi:hypothetical protein